MLDFQPKLQFGSRLAKVGIFSIDPANFLLGRNAPISLLAEPLTSYKPLIQPSPIGWHSWEPSRGNDLSSPVEVDRAVDPESLDLFATKFNLEILGEASLEENREQSIDVAAVERDSALAPSISPDRLKSVNPSSQFPQVSPKISENIDLQTSEVTGTDPMSVQIDRVDHSNSPEPVVEDSLPRSTLARLTIDLPPTIFHPTAATDTVDRVANLASERINAATVGDSLDRSNVNLAPTGSQVEPKLAKFLPVSANLGSEQPSLEQIVPSSKSATDLSPTGFQSGEVAQQPDNFALAPTSPVIVTESLSSPRSDLDLSSTIFSSTTSATSLVDELPTNLTDESINPEISVESQPQSLPSRSAIEQPTIFRDASDVVAVVPEKKSSEIIAASFPELLFSSDLNPPHPIFHAANKADEVVQELPTNLAADLKHPSEPMVDNPSPSKLDIDHPPTIFRDEIEVAAAATDITFPAALATSGSAKINPETVVNLPPSVPPKVDKVDIDLPPTVFHAANEIEAAAPELTPNLAPESINSETVGDTLIRSVPDRAELDLPPTVFRSLNEVAEFGAQLPANLAPEQSIDEVTSIALPQIAERDEPETILPVKGYATGGQVADTHRIGDTIHPSDTVAAMLTPKEFIVNVQAAQKNINLLEHINSGGELTQFITPNSDSPTASPASTREIPAQAAPLTVQSLQRTHDNLQRSSLADAIEDRQSSRPNTIEGDSVIARGSINNYDSPPLIFRQPKADSDLPATSGNAPQTQWNSVEDLLSGNHDRSTIFNFPDNVEPHGGSPNANRHDLASMLRPGINSTSNGAAMVSRFASAEAVISRDIRTDLQPITETISAPAPPTAKKTDGSGELETLAREIYQRLRQRLEIDRERQGIYNGRISW